MEILVIGGVLCLGIFIFSKFKKFENRKYEIINEIAKRGFKSAEALSIYDTNHYDISKMISAGYSVREIASRYAEKYDYLNRVTADSENKDNDNELEDDPNIKVMMELAQDDEKASFIKASVEFITGTISLNSVLLSHIDNFEDHDFTTGYVYGLALSYLEHKNVDFQSDVGQTIFSISLLNMFGEVGSNRHIDKLEAHESAENKDILLGIKVAASDLNGLFSEDDKSLMGLSTFFVEGRDFFTHLLESKGSEQKGSSAELDPDEINAWAKEIYECLLPQLHHNDISKSEPPLEVEFGYILGFADGYLQCREIMDDAKHFGLVTSLLIHCFDLSISGPLTNKFMKLEDVMTPDINEGLMLGMADAKIKFDDGDATIVGLTNALSE